MAIFRLELRVNAFWSTSIPDPQTRGSQEHVAVRHARSTSSFSVSHPRHVSPRIRAISYNMVMGATYMGNRLLIDFA